MLALPEGAPEYGTYLSSLDTDGVLITSQVVAIPFVYSIAHSARNAVIIAGNITFGSELAPVLPACSALSCPAPSSGGAIMYFESDLCW